MADGNFIGRRFAGMTDAEKQTLDLLTNDFQQKQEAFNTARVALQDYLSTLRDKYSLLPSTPFATGDLNALRAAEQARQDSISAAIEQADTLATDEEKAKYAAWVAAGRPVHKIDRVPDAG